MPFTPYHFGPGLLIQSILPKHSFSLTVFVSAQILIDIEVLYNLFMNSDRLHTFFHSYLGAIAATIIIVLAWVAGSQTRWWPIKWRENRKAVLFSAIIGTWSHIWLDSIMHIDMTPWSPMNGENSMLGLMSLWTLHWLCLISGLIGLVILVMRHLIGKYFALR